MLRLRLSAVTMQRARQGFPFSPRLPTRCGCRMKCRRAPGAMQQRPPESPCVAPAIAAAARMASKIILGQETRSLGSRERLSMVIVTTTTTTTMRSPRSPETRRVMLQTSSSSGRTARRFWVISLISSEVLSHVRMQAPEASHEQGMTVSSTSSSPSQHTYIHMAAAAIRQPFT